MAPKLLSIHEAAKALGVSEKTLRRWEQMGKIKSHRTPGGHRRYLINDLQKQARHQFLRFFSSQQVATIILTTIVITALTTFFVTNYWQTHQQQSLLKTITSALKSPTPSLPSNSTTLTTPSENQPSPQLPELPLSDSPSSSELNNPALPTNHTIIDSGIGLIATGDTFAFIDSNQASVNRFIDLELISPHQDRSIKVVKIIDQVGFFAIINQPYQEPLYFNWKISQ